jgi:hypothetical protein
MNTRTHEHTHTHTHTRTRTHAHAHTHTRTHAHMRAYIPTHIHVKALTYLHALLSTYCLHACIYVDMLTVCRRGPIAYCSNREPPYRVCLMQRFCDSFCLHSDFKSRINTSFSSGLVFFFLAFFASSCVNVFFHLLFVLSFSLHTSQLYVPKNVSQNLSCLQWKVVAIVSCQRLFGLLRVTGANHSHVGS